MALVFSMTVGIKKFPVLPDVVEASRRPAVGGKDQVVEISIGVSGENARVIHPNTTMNTSSVECVSCSIDSPGVRHLNGFQLDAEAVSEVV